MNCQQIATTWKKKYKKLDLMKGAKYEGNKGTADQQRKVIFLNWKGSSSNMDFLKLIYGIRSFTDKKVI